MLRHYFRVKSVQYCKGVAVVVVVVVVVAVENMCLVCSFIFISIPAPCFTNEVGLGVARKRSGQVLGEEAARRCCGKVLLKGTSIANMYRYDELTKGQREQSGQKERGQGNTKEYSSMDCLEG